MTLHQQLKRHFSLYNWESVRRLRFLRLDWMQVMDLIPWSSRSWWCYRSLFSPCIIQDLWRLQVRDALQAQILPVALSAASILLSLSGWMSLIPRCLETNERFLTKVHSLLFLTCRIKIEWALCSFLFSLPPSVPVKTIPMIGSVHPASHKIQYCIGTNGYMLRLNRPNAPNPA